MVANKVPTCGGNADRMNIQKSCSSVWGRNGGRGRVFQNRKRRVLLGGGRVNGGRVDGAAELRPAALLKRRARESVHVT